jgi:alkyl sulfatase BDS1-like metallo-beta-lactamase superfamily hydrolase
MVAELIERSNRYLDEGVIDGEYNPMTLHLHELGDGLARVDGFSHVITFDTGDGLVAFDTSLALMAPGALAAVRTWSDEPFHSLVYTHGHGDHVGGAPVFLQEAADRGDRRPDVVGHANITPRLERYEMTAGYVRAINARQFGGTGIARPGGIEADAKLPSWVRPSVSYDDRLDLGIGDTTFELHHGKGETDDHTWAWVPSHQAAVVGDFLIWSFPNAGNPQKVQRYPREWAKVLRQIASFHPALLLPAHGLPVQGETRVQLMLDETASALEHLVEAVLGHMNAGDRLDTIVHSVRVPAHLADRPWLRPLYDEPEFVIRNIWRLYGGWYDGNPARLKPAPDDVIAVETARLAGGVDVLVARAQELADADEPDFRLACHLVELAVQAEPANAAAHAARADVYGRRRTTETSLMARGIFGDASRTSRAVAEPD